MRNNDRFFLITLGVLYCQHIDFSLIDTKLAEVNIQEEYVSTLHAGIKELGDFELVWFLLSHNGGAFLDSCDRVLAGDVHNPHPIFVWPFVNFFWGPDEFNIVEFHSGCFPYLDKIFPYRPNFLQISIKLSIEHREIVSHPENENTPGIHHFVHIYCSKQSLGDMHPSWRLETVIGLREPFTLKLVSDQFIGADDLLSNWFNQFDPLLHGKSRGNRIEIFIYLRTAGEFRQVFHLGWVCLIEAEASCCPICLRLHVVEWFNEL